MCFCVAGHFGPICGCPVNGGAAQGGVRTVCCACYRRTCSLASSFVRACAQLQLLWAVLLVSQVEGRATFQGWWRAAAEKGAAGSGRGGTTVRNYTSSFVRAAVQHVQLRSKASWVFYCRPKKAGGGPPPKKAGGGPPPKKAGGAPPKKVGGGPPPKKAGAAPYALIPAPSRTCSPLPVRRVVMLSSVPN